MADPGHVHTHGSAWKGVADAARRDDRRNATPARRSTTVSAASLALVLGGVLGSLPIPRSAAAVGNPAGFLAGFLAGAAGPRLMAGLSLGLRPRPAAAPPRPVGGAGAG